MNIGDRIKHRRKQLDINADDLAIAAGVSRATIFRYENGDIEKMPAVTLEKIAKKLRTSPAYLMGWTESNEMEENESVQTIAAHIDEDVTEEEMEEILDYIKYRKQRRKKK
ncbi:helix-turn-helix domain-containing protein [Salinicoccus carnicancri]|uniref:helix-turn-helix domain-containing protein n=1 Tax=Salinicoccus carnicancri TaxID=558170 RepID=UPI00037A1FFE|nr:helix-turn-helix transcriptional regulator [Salinicoccus carnicancri]